MAKLGRDASGRLSEQIAGAIGWLARKRSVPRDVAEEAVQEALLQFVEMASGWSPSDFGGWLRRVAECRLLDAQRHLRTQVAASLDPGLGHDVADELDLDAVLALRASLRTLAPELSTVAVLRLMGGTWREVAALTGLGEDAARKRFELALIRLQASMSREGRP